MLQDRYFRGLGHETWCRIATIGEYDYRRRWLLNTDSYTATIIWYWKHDIVAISIDYRFVTYYSHW